MDARARREYFGKLRKGVELIGDRWFLDENVEGLGLRGEQEIENFSILIGSLAYVGGRNVLIYGNKGTGKTTWSEVISSVYSGMTQTLFDVLKIQGHPDQTKANMLARPDLGRLGEEGVVFQYSCYLPALTLDEFNRLTPGKQSIIMEYIRTGTVEELGKWLDRDDKPAFYATCNHNGDGTYPLPPPTVDRFDISLEFFAFSAPYDDQLKEIRRNIRDDLGDRKAAREVLSELARKDLDPQKKMKFMEEHAKKYRAEMKKRAGVEIPHLELLESGDDFGIPLTPHARTLLRCIHEEINRSRKYGENRASEKDKDSSVEILLIMSCLLR